MTGILLDTADDENEVRIEVNTSLSSDVDGVDVGKGVWVGSVVGACGEEDVDDFKMEVSFGFVIEGVAVAVVLEGAALVLSLRDVAGAVRNVGLGGTSGGDSVGGKRLRRSGGNGGSGGGPEATGDAA